MSAPAWTEWQPLPGSWQPSAPVLAETLDGGQSFRWSSETKPEVGPRWTGLWAGHVAHLRLEGNSLQWRAPAKLAPNTKNALPHYLGFDRDWAALTDSLPWRSDAHLAQCIAVYPGLRILRQPFGETLLGFLCSATKQIVQIKQMCALLAERHGMSIAPGYHRLPTWEELADIPEKQLRACLLGFRAKYIHGTAKFLARHPGWLEETEHLPYPEAKARLIELPGVGEKVADSTLR